MQDVLTGETGHTEYVFFGPWWLVGGVAFVLLALTLYVFRRRRKPD